MVIVDVVHGKILAERYGYTDRVTSIAWSHDGKRIATGGGDGEIVILDATTLEWLLTLPARENAVTCLVWSSDDRRLASVSGDLQIWGSPQIAQPPSEVARFVGAPLTSIDAP